MSKTKIVIASVLKPVQDSRAYFKLALSIRETNKYSLNIIGFSDKIVNNLSDLDFHSILNDQNSPIKRIWAQFKFFKLIISIQPKLLITTTPELLPISLFLKPFLRFKLIVDVQENTSLNIVQNRFSPNYFHVIVSKVIYKIEYYSRKFVDAYILAEKCYSIEFPFISNYLILENKYYNSLNNVQNIKLDVKQPLKFLISGTLTPVFGTVEGIIWFKELIKSFPHFQLYIIGHVPFPFYENLILNLSQDCTQITLNISRHPIDYEVILQAYADTDLHLLPYYDLPTIACKIPSKLYDCLALGIPVIYSAISQWKPFIESYSAGISVDFNQHEMAIEHLSKLTSSTFFTKGTPDESSFIQDKESLMNFIQKICNS
jgi:hypothetical protein